MKFARIIEELSQEYEINLQKNQECQEILDIALLDPNITTYNKHTLYFGYYHQCNQLHSFPEQCVLAVTESDLNSISLDTSVSMADSSGIALLSEYDFFSVFNRTKSIVESDRGDSLYREMIALADESHSIDAVINAAAIQFGNALIFIDVGFKIISASTSIPVIDPLWVQNLKQGFCSYEFIQAVKELEPVKHASQTAAPIEVTCPESTYRKLSSMIFLNNTKVGYILTIEQNTPFLSSHKDMLSTLSSAISYTIAHYFPMDMKWPSSYRQLFDDFLNGTPMSFLAPRIKSLDFPKRMATLFVQPMQYLGHSYLKDMLSKELKNIIPGTHLTRQKNSIVAVIPVEASMELSQETKTKLAHFAKEHQLKIGISNSYTSIESFNTRFQQACTALELGQRFHPQEKIYSYMDYQILAMFADLNADEHLGKFCHPALSILRQYDQKNHSQLYQTLRVYLEEDCSIKDAAAKLYIHRNSFVYRLTRITDLCQLNLEDAKTKLLLQISYIIDQYNGLDTGLNT